MKVIIAGGGGLLGSALSTSLIKDGHEVVIFTRNPDGLDWQVPGSRLVKWSTENMRGWASELDGSDVVINLAGASIAGNNPLELRWTTKRKQAIRESRKKAGEAITKAFRLAKKKPSVLIQASAIGAYGPSTGLNLDETSPRGNDFLATVTSDWEQSTFEAEEMGVRRIMLRTGLVLTRHGGLLPLLMLPYYFLAGGPIGTGKQYMSWIHLDDWVGAVRHLIASPNGSGIYNLTAEQPVTNGEFAKQLGQVMRRPSFFKTPSIVLQILLGESSTLALDGQHVVPARLIKDGFRFQYGSVKDALSAILSTPLRFRSQFQVKVNQPAVSDFHRDTSVLRRLTPFPIYVAFKHIEPIREGSEAHFTLWFGPVPVKWKARHFDFTPPFGFADEQVEGPFNMWVHHHSFSPLAGKGTRVQDEINFELGKRGLGWLMSRFMWLTLPVLFAFRSWRTKKDLATEQNGMSLGERGNEKA